MAAIEKVGVIGAGTMGNGIAQACAVAGLPVVMVDVQQAAVDRGLATVGGSRIHCPTWVDPTDFGASAE